MSTIPTGLSLEVGRRLPTSTWAEGAPPRTLLQCWDREDRRKIFAVKEIRRQLELGLRPAVAVWEELLEIYEESGPEGILRHPQVVGAPDGNRVQGRELNALVHALKSREAGRLNEAGRQAQLYYLTKTLGTARLRELLPHLFTKKGD